MSGIEEILGLIGAGAGTAGTAAEGAGAAGATASAAGGAGASGILPGTGMLAPFTEIAPGATAAGGIAPGTGMLANPGGAPLMPTQQPPKAMSSLLGGLGGNSGQAAMELMKLAASRRGPNAPAAMYQPPGGAGRAGQPTAAQWIQMLAQRPRPQLHLPGGS